MLDLSGTELTPAEADLLASPYVGGVILFSRNFVSVEQLQALVAAIRAVRADIILAVDQEGGRVQRFKAGFTRLPPIRLLGRFYDDDPAFAVQQAHEWGWLMAAEMRAVDIDLSFAPVLDLDFGRSQVIGNRAFHADPAVVSALAGAYIDGMAEAGMAATGKHFPGHGWVVADSHVDIPVDDRVETEILNNDMMPFKVLAKQLKGIMPAHVIYPHFDENPAGFSHFWLQQMLREKLGFEGVIFSDDLAMEGASVVGGYTQRAAAALKAGCDMVLVCNHRPGALEVLDWLHGQALSSTNPRIAALRGTSAPSLEDLRNSDRWQQVQYGMAESLKID